jgi:hypothetical protein
MNMVMRNSHLAVALGLWLALAACSKSTQDKTGQDLKAVGADTSAAAKSVAAGSAMKDLGSDIKQGTAEAADKTKDATVQAGDKLKAGADVVGDKLKAGAKDAASSTQDAASKAKDKLSH